MSSSSPPGQAAQALVPEFATRLARVIGQDIALYNADKLKLAIAEDRLFEAFADDMREGWLTYRSRLPPHVDAEGHHLRSVLCEVLLGAQGHVRSALF